MEANFFLERSLYRMARKPKITAVPVEQAQREEGLMIAMDAPHEKTDA